MTTVTVDTATKTIAAQGHAGAEKNAQGHDLVCCAISTLAQAYYYAGLKKGYRMELQSEKGRLVARPGEETEETAELTAIFDGYALGLTLIAENYPKNVQIKWVSDGLS